MAMQPSPTNSPHWNRNTKLIVTVAGLLLITLGIWRFSYLIRYVVIAGIIAYLLNPVIQLVADRTPLKRGHAILLSYLALIALMVWATISIGVAGFNQVNTLIVEFPSILENGLTILDQLSQRSFTIFGFTLDLSTIDWQSIGLDIAAQAENAIGTVLERSTSVVGGAVGAAVSGVSALANFVLIIMMSIYISQDVPRLGSMVIEWADMPGYRADAEQLWLRFGRIWRAYLRGQFILAITMWIVVWFSLAIAGVNNAFALGFLSGIFEFLPVIGPLIAGGVAVFVALFQPENWMGLTTIQYGLVVLVIMLVLQQLENSILVPRIVGKSLDLHPLWTILVVFMGSTVAGILGAILAAPVAATVKLLGSYAWRKLFDQPPFPQPLKDDEDAGSSMMWAAWSWVNKRVGRLRARPKKVVAKAQSGKGTGIGAKSGAKSGSTRKKS